MRGIDQVREFIARARPPGSEEGAYPERRQGMDGLAALQPLPEGWAVTEDRLGRRMAERAEGPSAAKDRALLYLHGGGYCIGSPKSHRGLAAHLAAAAGVTGFALDYRLAPENPFPAGLEDAVDAYQTLLARGFAPKSIAIGGDSAGGGLTLATALRLKSLGLPQPACLLAISPWANLKQEGESFQTKAALDPICSKEGLDAYARDYLAGHLALDPLASPVFGDLTGLAPLLIQTGQDEVLLTDSETLAARAKAADLDFSLEIWPGMIHVFHAFYPLLEEGREAIALAGKWMQRRFA
jgi:acetyl esterase/lipase